MIFQCFVTQIQTFVGMMRTICGWKLSISPNLFIYNTFPDLQRFKSSFWKINIIYNIFLPEQLVHTNCSTRPANLSVLTS